MNRSLNSKIYNARKTLLEFMKAQDMDISDYEHFGMNDIHTLENVFKFLGYLYIHLF